MYLKSNISKLLIFFLLFISIDGFAQFGNEWISQSQTYYKIKVGEDGIYRIDYTTLAAKGLPVSTINPKNFQLFRNGEEQYIYVNGEDDNSFEAGDFIEFFGEKNDGRLDTKLYRTPEDQPHTFYSLHTDTSYYFLTWKSTPSSKRIKEFYDGDYNGKLVDPYFMHEVINTYTTDFFHGLPNANQADQLFSEYTGGEGFYQWIWSNQAKYNIELPAVHSAGPSTNIEVLAYSGNNNLDVIVNNANHEFGVSIGTKSNLIASKKTLAYEKIFISKNVQSNQLSSTTPFYMGEITYAGSGIFLSYLKVTYPRLFDLSNTSRLRINSIFNSTFCNFKNYPITKDRPIVYDFKTNRRIFGDKQPDHSISFNLPQSGSQNIYITDRTDIKTIGIGNLADINKTGIVPNQNVDYLIISNEKLDDGTQKFKDYRSSLSGGEYNVHSVNVQDLFNFFNYGMHGPHAIKSYINFLKVDHKNLKHILLLGKGQTYRTIRTNENLKIAYDLLPVIGHPASDNLYVGDLSGKKISYDFSIGRIPARDNKQIFDYIDKLDAFENQPIAYWQKKIIQLAGGVGDENRQYQSYLNNYYKIIQDTSFGGYRVLFSKNEPVPIQESLTGQIQNELNDGSAMLSYFGHGAAQVTEISLGKPAELDNFGKTPLFLFNGCALGNTFGSDLSLAEEFLFEPKKGALGWIASSNTGFTSPLYNHTIQIHKKLFQDNYGEGVGVAMREASHSFGNPASSHDRIESRQLVYHGDPALRIFSPSLPDYIVTNSKIESTPGDEDSLLMNIGLSNLGKAIVDDLTININITNSSGIRLYNTTTTIKTPYNRTETQLKIPSSILKGLLTITLTLDSANTIAEFLPDGEINNQYIYQHLIKQKSPDILKPLADAIVPSTNVNTLIQLPGHTDIERTLIVEWDSTPYFTSPIGFKSFVTKKTLNSMVIELPVGADKDYYIRTKYNENGEESDWVYRTFGYIKNDPEGWTEGNKWKFVAVEKSFITVDTISGTFNFKHKNGPQYKTETAGDGITNQSRWIQVDGTPTYFNWVPDNGITLMVLDDVTGERYFENSEFNLALPNPWGSYPSYWKYNKVGEKCAFYHYNTNEEEEQDSLAAFLNRIPKDHHLIMQNAYNCDVTMWNSSLWDALSKYGVTKIQSLAKGEPFTIISNKKSQSVASEFIADYNDIITPPLNQRLVNAVTFTIAGDSGTMRTKVIGPAANWHRAFVEFKEYNNSDSLKLTVYGSADEKAWKKIKTSYANTEIDLESIDVNIYPYIYIEATLYDLTQKTPPSIDKWKVHYEGPSEGVVDLDYNFSINKDTLQEGEPLILSIGFTNILDKRYKKSDYNLVLLKQDGNSDTIKTGSIEAIDGLQSIAIRDTISTISLVGSNEVLVSFNYNKNIQEYRYDNNFYGHNFEVQGDFKKPTLDVVFDGIHIMDEDIVSPYTTITMSVLDKNKYFLVDDPSYIFALLTHPDGAVDTLNLNQANVSFTPSQDQNTPAILVYNAENLSGGSYKLNVKVRDRSGNNSSDLGYSINFKVVRESSISNLYPYPNPFSSSTKFVFTLTGEVVPDYMKIQILSISGKIVKEISKQELGNVKIGHNISEYSWTGLDQYGDPLANGVYFYKVISKINNEDISLYDTAGDEFFTNGMGKLYLMR